MADEELDEIDGLLPLPIDRSGAGIGVRDNRDAALGADADQPRLSLGQRIAGVKDPAAAPPDAAPVVRPQFDPNAIPESIRPRALKPEEIPVAPTGVNNPNLAALAKKQAEFSTPVNPMDTATGKIKPQYRMGLGQRILGAVADFGLGFSGQPGMVKIGPGATNWRFGREEGQREKELAGVNEQIGTQEKLGSENEKLYRDAIQQAYKAQLGEKDVALGNAAKENADTKAQLAQFKIDQGPTNKTADTVAERTQVADEQGLKGEERKSYILTGKLPNEGRQPTELDQWTAAFRRDNGRNPTADEIANRKARTSSKSDQIEKDKDTALQRAEAKATERLSKLKFFDPTDKRPIDQRKQAIYDDLEKEKAQAQKEYETRAAQNASSNRGPASASPKANTSTPAKTSAPPKPTQAPPAGRVWVYDLKTGKRGTVPKDQLSQAKRQGYGTW